MKMKTQQPKPMGFSKSSAKGEVHSNTSLLQETYRTFHPKTLNFTFFSSTHGTFSRIDHILDHKSSLGKLKKKKSFQASFLTTMQYD